MVLIEEQKFAYRLTIVLHNVIIYHSCHLRYSSREQREPESCHQIRVRKQSEMHYRNRYRDATEKRLKPANYEIIQPLVSNN